MSKGRVAPSKPKDDGRCHVAHAWLTGEKHELLELEAQRRDTHPDRLAASILDVVLSDSLVDAILDR